MSVLVVKGNLFEANTQAIINTVNTKGKMGKGVALEFKQRYPEMFKEYAKLCKKNLIQVGKVWIWRPAGVYHGNGDSQTTPEYIINFPTKDDWRNLSKLEWISTGLDDLRYRVIMLEIESIALPALGCANGGLNFEDVRALVEEKLNDLQDTSVILYEPQ